MKVLYTTQATSTGGRTGHSKTADGVLDLDLITPKELGGPGNPPGGKGTTRDTLELALKSERHGARVALFGRKIQLAESPLDVIALMRPVIRGDLTPADAVRAYHAALAKRGLRAVRSLEDDSAVTEPVLRPDSAS